ncbi:hypothetical protein ACIGZI_34520 [Streptomyces griseus]|uniref:hypothetical protein n=1 Tax=Streptomyces griseus TaxID=1911 RepID=UPI0037D98DF2
MTVRVDSNSQLTPEQERVYRLRNAAERDGGTPGGFLELLAAVVADETWRQTPSGVSAEPFSSFAEFIEAKPPFGLGRRVEDVHVLLQMQHPHEAAAEFRSKMENMRSEVRRLLAEDGITGYSEQQRDRDIQAWAALDRSGSWWLAFFVACQVRSQASATPTNGESRAAGTKLSAAEFARRAGTSPERVLRYYKAWEAAHAAGAVAHGADELWPGHEPVGLPPAEDWTLYYSSRRGATTDRGALISAAAEAEGIRPTKALEVAENPTALRAAILADPRTAEAARAALKALTSEEKRSEHLEYVRQVAEEGKAQAASGQLIMLPEQVRAQVSEQLAAVAETPTDPELVSSAYDLVQELVSRAVEADPEAHATEQRARFQTALKATRKSIATIDPARFPDVVDDGLREEISALQEAVNALVASITRHT